VLFATELLQSLGNRHANEREPRRNPSQQRKIHNHSTPLMHRKRLMMRGREIRDEIEAE
jgi:hypothetical protein